MTDPGSRIGQAVLLVGGMGTRLGATTALTPKPMLTVAGQPFIHYLLQELRRHQIEDVLLLSGYLGEQLESVRSAFPQTRIAIEPQPRGTAGALRSARAQLAQRFFLMNGDTLFDINLWDLAGAAGSGGALAVCRLADASRFGAVTARAGRITTFEERATTPGPGLINAGVGVFSRDVLDLIPDDPQVSMERDVLPVLAKAGRLVGRAYDRPFIDIGTPEDLERAQTWIPQVLDRPIVTFSCHELLESQDLSNPVWRADAARKVKAVNDCGALAVLAASLKRAGQSSAEGDEHFRAHLNQALVLRGAHIDVVVPAPGI